MGGREGEKIVANKRGREANHKRLLNTENNLRVDGGVGEWGRRGVGERGK